MKYAAWSIVLVIVIGGIWYITQSSTIPAPAGDQATLPIVEDAPVEAETVAEAHEVVVNGSSFKFDPAEIRVKEGTRVRIVFNNTGGTHDFVLDAFNVRTKLLQGGASDTIEFVADKKGTFEYYCSVGTHRQMGMKGNLIVE